MDSDTEPGDRRWLLLASSMVSFFVVVATFFAVPPLIPELRILFDLSNFQVGALMGAIAFPAIGATATSLLFISGLLIASLVYDHVGALNLAANAITLQKAAGVLLVMLGSYIALRSPA